MPVMTASSAELALVRQLMHDAARRQAGMGDEDLAESVAAGHVLLLVDGGGPPAAAALQRADVRALAAFYPEPRPPSLPAGEPDRVFLRAAAFRSGASPSSSLAELVDQWCSGPAGLSPTGGQPRLLIAYGGEPWFNRALAAAHFRLAEEVIYLELPELEPARLLPPADAGGLALRSLSPAEINELAALDAACFNVLWHMGVADLRQLLMFGRVTVAEEGGALIGYLALTVKEDVAQIARVAVHPAWSGRGIGRRLLVDGLLAAYGLGCRRGVLNTQATNTRAQGLYRSLGFRPTGERFEVYTRVAEEG